MRHPAPAHDGGTSTSTHQGWPSGRIPSPRNSHSFDPRTGRPIANGVRSVTVLHRQCMIADGWATALTVLGAEAGIALANERDLAACILANGREHVSRAWAAMLD